ncbi:MAG: M20/M25/M40 family metallo-hydrolase [Planctomycetes bacterium]|nr:M20/M25/M40 family metallo-hydrolase [Planctomycetota bacterium]
MLRSQTALWAALSALAGLAGGCQQADRARIDRDLIGEVMMGSEFAENLRAIAQPGGRVSGSPNAHAAERYVADKLREYGLANVHLEPFEMMSWYDRSTVVTVLDEPPCLLAQATGLGNTLSTPPEGVTAEVLDMGAGGEEQFEEASGQLPGKYALVSDGGASRRQKAAWAVRYGAAGLIVHSRPGREVLIGNGHAEPHALPVVVIGADDGAALVQRLSAGERVRLNVTIDAESWLARPNNVVGEIPGMGSLANEVVILGAHLDSWHLAEGAIDNANGAATVLETARALARVEWRPRRTLRFILFMGEEHGLRGSQAYVQAHAAELDDIVAVVNVDMPGAPRQFGTCGHPEIVDFLKSVQEALPAYEISPDVGNSTGFWSDHAPFMRAGVCAVYLSGELGPGAKYYHTARDTYDQVDRRQTVQSAAVFAVLLRRLADCPERPSARFDPVGLQAEMGW